MVFIPKNKQDTDLAVQARTSLPAQFRGACILEVFFPEHQRRFFAHLFTVGIVVSIIATGVMVVRSVADGIAAPSFSYISPVVGLIFLLAGLRLSLLGLESFVRSQTKDPRGRGAALAIMDRFNLYAARLWYRGVTLGRRPGAHEIAQTLARTAAGRRVLLRLGIAPKEYQAFCKKLPKKSENSLRAFLETLQEVAPRTEVTLAALLTALFRHDSCFRNFLLTKNVTDEMLAQSALWVERHIGRQNSERRWWSRSRLGRIPGIGKNWAYGYTYFLEQFAHNLRPEAYTNPQRLVGREHLVERVESALLRGSGANVLLVGEPGVGKRTIVMGLTRMISEGTIFPELEHKQIFELTGPAITATGKTKGKIEEILLRILNEAGNAGNIILVISNFPEFVESLNRAGVNTTHIFDQYLTHPRIHIIALADSVPFRQILEMQEGLLKHFEKIDIEEPDEEKLLAILESVAPSLEAGVRGKTIFTIQSLSAIAEGATRYLVTGGLPERAIDLMDEVFGRASAEHLPFVTEAMALMVLQQKTHMPLGAIKKEEQKKLLNLEEEFHKHIINQEEAIRSIADAIRRSRVDIRDPKRPIGTFLFLGPTGVGKTETAKTLAKYYFGNDEALLRFDMTEYQSAEGLERLIGSAEKNEPGILASRVRKNPYAVVLLDEFEKAGKNVIDLFLQILDEGFFTEAHGDRINMRNTIIIATSNAGSRRIAELIEDGKDQQYLKREVTEHIQKEGAFRPELLNRFDSIIVFRPLTRAHLRDIARLMLGELAERLANQNIRLRITDELVDAVARGGYDPTYGARPMRRFIQDTVEKKIAEKMISGEIIKGSEFTLSIDDGT